MENSNSREYLDKITAAVIDNLRQTGPAPSVQMQDVPRKPFGGMTDEEEAELDDLDEDENKDERMTEHRWDKRIEHDAELEPSDDEDMSKANGATRRSGNKRAFTDHKKSEMDVDSTNASPKNGNEAEASADTAVDAHDPNDDTIDDPTVAEPDKETEPAEKDKESEKAKVDGDGDVGMDEPEAVEDATKIKQEETEPEAAPAPVSEDKPANAASAEPASTEDKPTEKDAGAEKPQAAQPEEKDAEAAKADDAGDAMDVDAEKDKPEAKEEKAS
jgi:histone deacetylase 1/2